MPTDMNNSTSLTLPAPLFSARSILGMLGISLVYLLLSYLLIGFKPEQVFLLVLINALYFISRPTRQFITGFSIFIVYWVIFDYMKAFPNYQYQPVHIESLYHAEKQLFGTGPFPITPNEYWLSHRSNFLDVLTGLFYLCWVPVPLAFAAYLFYKDRAQFLSFALSFLLVNLIGFAVYYIYPAAPPWYVQLKGFRLDTATKGNTAGLAHFDHYFNISVFRSLYEKSSNVFAAMPSLHSAYPLLVLYYGWRNKLGKINLLFALLSIGIWFSAIYNSHHYVLDVLAGICCCIAGILLFHYLNSRIRFTQAFFARVLNVISR